MRVKRQGIIIWFQHTKNIKHLKRYGHLIYVSKKQKYALIYVNQDDVDHVETNLMNLPFVDNVQRSYKPELCTKFETFSSNQDEACKNSHLYINRCVSAGLNFRYS